MYIKINEQCDCCDECESKDFLALKVGKLRVVFFDDYGYKFIYVYWGEKFKRWQF